MNRSIFLSLALIASLATACAPTNLIETEDVVPIDEPSNNDDQKKFKPSKDMISINPLKGNYTVKVGQQVYYTADVHGSVGSTATARSTVKEVLAFQSEVFEYNNEKSAEMPGGDAAKRYFIFDAVKVGTSEVMVQHLFRGELQNEYTITITVVEN